MAEPTTTTPQRTEAQINTELSMRRTGMSFQRTRMSADRTLMSIIRTSLSLISFGFTIYQFFNKLKDSGVLKGTATTRSFGSALVWLGIGLLVLGIVYHLMFMTGLRRQRNQMRLEGLVHAESGFPPSLVLIAAIALLLIGLFAAGHMDLAWGE
jgi:putative membrane protein